MPSPQTSAEPRPLLLQSLEQFNLAQDRLGFIGQRVLPVIDVQLVAGPFGKIPLEQLLQIKNDTRNPGGGYNRGNWTFTADSYYCQEHGWEEPVDDREAQMYKDYFDAEVVATQRAQDFVLRNAEIRAASLVFDTSVWTGSSLTTAISTPWTNHASATPIADIRAACKKVWDGTGIWPDTLVIDRNNFNDLRLCGDVIDAVQASGAGQTAIQGKFTPAILADVFDLPKILVAGSAKNTANQGQTRSLSSIWSSSYAMVCKTADSNDLREPCIGRTFHWSADGSEIGGLVESYRDETKRSNIVRVRMDVHEKIIYKELGHLMSGTR